MSVDADRERVVRALLEHPAEPETEIRALVDALSRAEDAESAVERVRALVENGPYAYYPVGLGWGFAKAIPVSLLLAALPTVPSNSPAPAGSAGPTA